MVEPVRSSRADLGEFGRRAEVLIAMFDTRPLHLSAAAANSSSTHYWELSAQLNHLYACHHQYDFRYYTQAETFASPAYGAAAHAASQKGAVVDALNDPSKVKGTCWFRGQVLRASPWCKLAAVAEGLARGYRTVVMIDSDAFFKSGQLAVPVDRLVLDFRIKANESHEPTGGPRVPLWMPSNEPYEGPNRRPNTGMQIWRGGDLLEESWRVLRQWWARDSRPREHPFEQSGLQGLQAGSDFGVLRGLPWMDENVWRVLPAVHIGSLESSRRLTLMGNALKHVGSSRRQKCGEIKETDLDTTATAKKYLERGWTQCDNCGHDFKHMFEPLDIRNNRRSDTSGRLSVY